MAKSLLQRPFVIGKYDLYCVESNGFGAVDIEADNVCSYWAHFLI